MKDLPIHTGKRRQRGFALLIVLWTVGLLALLGTRIVASGRSDTQLADNLGQEAKLEAAANGAIAEIVFRSMAAHDPRFQPDGIAQTLQISNVPVIATIENENDRINLNTASGILLRSLMIELGSAPSVADRLSAAVLDWRTAGVDPRPGGAKAAEYRAAGRAYGPPNSLFQTVGELQDVLGVTPELFDRMAPHLTVLTDGDPDMSTRDPIVARALIDANGTADDALSGQQTADPLLRIHLMALGARAAHYSLTVVVAADFQAATPHVDVLLRERDYASVRVASSTAPNHHVFTTRQSSSGVLE